MRLLVDNNCEEIRHSTPGLAASHHGSEAAGIKIGVVSFLAL